MLIVFPIGLWVFSFIADLVFLASGNPAWDSAAFYTLIGGLVGALLAAVPGFLDFLSIEQSRTRVVAFTHMTINLCVVALYAINLWLRTRTPPLVVLPVILSGASVVLLAVSGWLGGELVYLHGMAVDTEAMSAERRDRRRAA